jgi:hypothetical protein
MGVHSYGINHDNEYARTQFTVFEKLVMIFVKSYKDGSYSPPRNLISLLMLLLLLFQLHLHSKIKSARTECTLGTIRVS